MRVLHQVIILSGCLDLRGHLNSNVRWLLGESQMKRRFTSALLLFLVIPFLSSATGAHLPPRNGGEGRVSGVVLDVNDSRVTRAKVTIEAQNYRRELSTSAEGAFELDLPAGQYHFTVDAYGFCKFQGEPLKIKSGATEMINIHLEGLVYDSPAACKCTSRPRRKIIAAPPNTSLNRSGISLSLIRRT